MTQTIDALDAQRNSIRFQSRRKRLDAVIAHVESASHWNALLALVPVPHVTQSYAYGAGKAADGWTVRRLAFSVGGETAAICQILEKRVAGMRIATRVNRGPVFLSETPGADVVVAVYRALRRGWGRLLTGPLVLAPALLETEENNALMRAAGYWSRSTRGWRSATIDLSSSEDEIFASFSSTFRNRYRKAEKQGVTFEVSNSAEAIEWLIDRHSTHMESVGVRHKGLGFFHALAAEAGEDFFIVRAVHQGEYVGGTALIRSGRMTEYDVGWHSPDARDLNLGNYLMWNAICEAKRRGATVFDVGGLTPETKGGFTQFKRGMNGADYELLREWVAI